MFERNRVDNTSDRQTSLVPAEVTLQDGAVLAGKFVVAGGRALYSMLNGTDAFVEFEPHGEGRRLIAKSAIRAVALTPVPAAGQLSGRLRELDGLEPAGILGIAEGASIDDARAAYHRLARSYHPDRFASVDLPGEVRDYLAAVSRRINFAFAAIEQADVARKRRAEAPKVNAPVYTSQPRY